VQVLQMAKKEKIKKNKRLKVLITITQQQLWIISKWG